MQDKPAIDILLKGYILGILTPEEEQSLNDWFEAHPDVEAYLSERILVGDLDADLFEWADLIASDRIPWEDRLRTNVLTKTSIKRRTQLRLSRFVLPMAASLLLIGSLVIWQMSKDLTVDAERIEEVADVAPGSHKAKIILSTGEEMDLSEQKGIIVISKDIQYGDGTPLIDDRDIRTSFTISVPQGGRYCAILPDNSKVWLNSNTTLRCPAGFGDQEREIYLDGEAYFEVSKLLNSHGRKTPFLVNTGGHLVTVTGTAFNLKAYPGEPVRTTLVEGGVQLSAGTESIVLRPGEQGISDSNRFVKKRVDLDCETAWKEGKFIFNDTELNDAMKLISRWYDVEVRFEKDISPTYFFGEISMDKTLNETLGILRAGGVSFSLDRNRDGKIRLHVNE